MSERSTSDGIPAAIAAPTPKWRGSALRESFVVMDLC